MLHRFLLYKKDTIAGRPSDSGKQHWLEVLFHWLEDEGETEKMTVADIHKKMTDLANGEEVYGIKRLREKLQNHYGNHIF